jgi:acetate kinase
MRILTLNSGSSSIKCALIDSETNTCLFEARIDHLGEASVLVAGDAKRELGALNYDSATMLLLDEAQRAASGHTINAIAHRIVHGGEYSAPVMVDERVLAAIRQASELAPLHNPPALTVLQAAQRKFAALPHVAVFDTAFHRTLPARAREYALPRTLARAHSLYRVGFHGVSHAHVLHATAEFLHADPKQLRIVSCHLGNGASVTAIEYGRSVETSMGMTPLEGLVMGTRGGDLDPGIVLHLLKSPGFDVDRLDRLLNSESGLMGLTGTIDFAAIERRAAAGDEDCRRAIAIYTHRIRKYIGAYVAVMGGVDVIAFTGGVGEHSALVRHRASQRLDFLGAVFDEDRNRDVRLTSDRPVVDIAAAESRVRILAVRADEQLQLAREAAALLARHVATNASMTIPLAVSARHAHLSTATIERLFGPGYQLRKHCDLSQQGQYSAEETIALIGPHGRIDRVRLMGPPRRNDQIEISRTDEFILGVDAPVRLSGDLANTPGITLEGPRGRVTIPNGVICARRHIHMNPDDARRFDLGDGDTVQVRINSGRELIFADVIVRVSPAYRLELHLDTDEANAAGIGDSGAAGQSHETIQAILVKQ